MREIRSRRRAVRLAALAGLVAVLVAVAAGCGGGGGGSSNTTTGNSSVSGSVKFWGIWAATEQKAFQKVIDGFHKQYPNVTVTYSSKGNDIPTVLSTAIAGGNPPDMADVAQPGLVKQLVQQGKLKPITYAHSTIAGQLHAGVGEAGRGQRQGLRAPLQGVEQVDPLVQRQRPQAGRGRRAEDVVADGQRGQDDQGVGHTRVLALRSERVDPHGHLREPLPPQVGAGEVRPAQRPPDQVDRSDGDQVAAGHGSGRRRHREHLWRHERRAADRLPDVRRLHVRDSAEGGVQPPGRLREPRDPPGDEGEAREGLQRRPVPGDHLRSERKGCRDGRRPDHHVPRLARRSRRS